MAFHGRRGAARIVRTVGERHESSALAGSQGERATGCRPVHGSRSHPAAWQRAGVDLVHLAWSAPLHDDAALPDGCLTVQSLDVGQRSFAWGLGPSGQVVRWSGGHGVLGDREIGEGGGGLFGVGCGRCFWEWNLLMSRTQDSGEAAEHLAATILRGDV